MLGGGCMKYGLFRDLITTYLETRVYGDRVRGGAGRC